MKYEMLIILLLFSALCLTTAPFDSAGSIANVAPASQQHSSVSQAEIDKYYNTIIESNNELQEMPNKYRDTTPSLPKPDNFDIEAFLDDMDQMECVSSAEHPNTSEKYKRLCTDRLTQDTFSPLGEYQTDHNAFYDYLNSNIYMPLAYTMSRPQNLSGTLVDLVTLSNKSALFQGRPVQTDFNAFQRAIFALFSRVQGNTSNVDANQELISELMISILKRFHLYWNQLRYKDQVDKIKGDTKDIMRNILKEYQVKEKFLFEVTRTLVEHIKGAYMRFMKAHKSVRILNKTAPSMISHAVLTRYEKLLDAIKFSHYTDIKLVRELTYILDLQESFYVVNYKMGINEPRSMLEFQTEVMENIQHSYNFYVGQIGNSDKARLAEIRNFTATLLLKMKHMEFIIFRYRSITEFANMSKTTIYERDPLMVKLYYELLDNMLTIPKKCVNYLVLKSCALHETNKSLRYVANKYMLKRSNKGWIVFDYTQNVLRHLFSKSNDLVFSNWTIFKSYFYQNLFSVMYNFKKRYYIGDEDTVEDLESLIGDSIDGFKVEKATAHIDFGIIDQLDKDLYDKFLDIKANYNKFAPFDKDPQIFSSIENDLTTFFMEFKSKYKSAINEDFILLLERVKIAVDKWRADSMSKPELSIQVATLPITMGPVPQVYHSIVPAISGPSAAQSNEQIRKLLLTKNSDANNMIISEETHEFNKNNDQIIKFRDDTAHNSVKQETEAPNTQTEIANNTERSLFDDATEEPDKIPTAVALPPLIADENKSPLKGGNDEIHNKLIKEATGVLSALKSTRKDMTLKPKVKDVWSAENLIPNHAVVASDQDKNIDQGLEGGIYFK